MRHATLIVASLVAGAVGAYAGLFALLAVTGLDEPEWTSVLMLTGAAFFGSLTASLIATMPAATAGALVGGATAVGAIVGLGIMSSVDSFDWMVGSGVVLVTAVAIVARRLESSHSERPQGDDGPT